MTCPACGVALAKVTMDDIIVDVCEGGCGGVWFDSFELQKFDEPYEEAGRELLDVRIDRGSSVDQSRRLRCPKCEHTVLMRHFFSVKQEVEVDECPSCAGFWLEVGELRKIRSEFPSEDARRQAAAQYFDDVFGRQLDSLRKESEEKRARARKIANIFRFICPSYYIPGKQEWGAF